MVGSVVGRDLVDPRAVLADTSVHGRCAYIAVAVAPGDDANKHPHVPLLADKRASGVTLREEEGRSQCGGCRRTVQRTGQGARAYLTRGGPRATSTDHGVSDT